MKKIRFATELCYVFGILILALGTALMERANFGLSMVVAPAYLLYLKLSEIFPKVTFGTMDYLVQAALLVAMIPVMRKFRIAWLFSFVTAVLYGLSLDGFMLVTNLLPAHNFLSRSIWYLMGLVLCPLGVAMYFRTYLAPGVAELFVKELAQKQGKEVGKVKLAYDGVCCITAVIMSFVFFGLWKFEGIKLGTILCAFVNGHIINFFVRLMDRHLEWTDALPLRKFFEGTERVTAD